jgi:hypothetical protein
MAKGGDFEREIATLISLNWTNGKRDDIFWRTGGSGARATSRFKRGKQTANEHGDLGYKDEIGKPLIDVFNFELKTGYRKKRKNKSGIVSKTNWCLLDCIDSSNTKNPVQFKEFWQESLVDAEKTGREPIVIFRRPNKRACMGVPTSIFHVCIDLFGVPPFDFIDLSDDDGNYTIYSLDKFLDWCKLTILVEKLNARTNKKND